MEKLNMNYLLNRNEEKKSLIDFMNYFEKNKTNNLTRRGIYIYGNPGIGKTFFAKTILKEMGYDTLLFDTGNIRNKNAMNIITKDNISNKNVISFFHKKKQKMAIIMDEIDGLNSGDKGGINYLIKMIRPKKTKKQKNEVITALPIICIGNYHIDKKIKELKKVCNIIELKTPTNAQIKYIIKLLMPNYDEELLDKTLTYINGDLRKLISTYKIYKNQENILKSKIIHEIFKPKILNCSTKKITKQILLNPYLIADHSRIMNETDRTSVGLLFHENVIDAIEKFPKDKALNVYLQMLNNICYADYIDRITFQKQIWCFNEMSSMIKTFYNQKILHSNFKNIEFDNEIRFTKVLTKYSTEYNNMLFFKNLSKKLAMDNSDLMAFFLLLKKKHTNETIFSLFKKHNLDISKLDIQRFYRFVDNCYQMHN